MQIWKLTVFTSDVRACVCVCVRERERERERRYWVKIDLEKKGGGGGWGVGEEMENLLANIEYDINRCDSLIIKDPPIKWRNE